MTAIAKDREKLLGDLKCVVRDSEKLLHDSTEAVGEKAEQTRELLARTLERAKSSCQQLEEKAKKGLKATDRVVRRHPYQALGISLGIGFILGALIRRKSH